ncbi:alginate export family protein [Microbulbifer sp.]|uniref:alginate export family protein n=1 Tax=Microbulbifer sp. TaxID=1908541 RepID=UPI003F2DE0C4
MITQKFPSLVCSALLCASGVASSHASAEDTAQTFSSAVQNGDLAINLRYRAENVDRDKLSNDATASTLRTRLSWQSGNYRGFSAMIEMDDVTAIGQDNYNSTTNGQTDYPVVADPLGTEVNQAYLQYGNGTFKATAGRQRIVLDDQRFVGGVAWRQNEQTFDGYRFRYGRDGALRLDYSYIYNVNRIFGEDSEQGNLEGDIQIFRTGYPLTENHKLVFLAVDLQLEHAVDASSRTLALRYSGAFGPVNAQLGYARQTEAGDSGLDYSAPYYLAELDTDFGPVNVRLGYEELGADNGVGFSTPLATLHKFQGFADQFLSTPADGIEDLYLSAAGGLAGGTLSATYHRFSAVETSADWGSEWDLGYSRKLTEQLSATVKYASYRADAYSVDTDKLWLMLTASF